MDNHCNEHATTCSFHEATTNTFSLHFEETPCCNIETIQISTSDYYPSSKTELSNMQVLILSNLFSLLENKILPKLHSIFSKTELHKLYGSNYRISLQTFLI